MMLKARFSRRWKVKKMISRGGQDSQGFYSTRFRKVEYIYTCVYRGGRFNRSSRVKFLDTLPTLPCGDVMLNLVLKPNNNMLKHDPKAFGVEV